MRKEPYSFLIKIFSWISIHCLINCQQYESFGCFDVDPIHSLQPLPVPTTNGQMTNALCQTTCSGINYAYTQDKQCYCSHDINILRNRGSDAWCELLCPGHKGTGEKCGSLVQRTFSVYKSLTPFTTITTTTDSTTTTTTTTASTTTTTTAYPVNIGNSFPFNPTKTGNYSYSGCYDKNAIDVKVSTDSTNNNNHFCAAKCFNMALGYSMTKGSDCFCISSLAGRNIVSDHSCSQNCPSTDLYSNARCGFTSLIGTNFLSVYKINFQGTPPRLDQLSADETTDLYNSFLTDPSNDGKDPIASLAESSPTLMLNLLQMEGQDMTGCLSNCSNNGRCAIDANNKFGCSCFQYFEGDSCETDSRSCSSKPCQNNATCQQNYQVLSEYTCNCSSSLYFGKRCENKVNICWNQTCSNNGRCSEVNGKANCECFTNFFGIDCSKESEALKTVKSVRAFASIAAIVTLSIFFGGIFLMDYSKYIHPHVVRRLAYNKVTDEMLNDFKKNQPDFAREITIKT